MKMKKYISPEMYVVEIDQKEQIMAASSSEFVSDDEGLGDDDMFSPGGFWEWSIMTER